VRWSSTARTALAVAGALLLVGIAVVAVQQVRASQAETAAAEHVAKQEHAHEVDRMRRALAVAADGAGTSSAQLRLNLAESVRGSDRGARTVIEERRELLRELRETARTLDEAGSRIDATDEALPVADDDPLRAQVEEVEEQAAWVAAHLRDTADAAERWGRVTSTLSAQAEAFAERDLPTTDDPDELAAKWRNESEELSEYRDAAEAALDTAGLGEVGEAHLRLVDGMSELAEEAASLLGDGEVDAYNELLAERLEGEDPFGFREALSDALDGALDAEPIAAAEGAQERSLGLLEELERLRPLGTVGSREA
jgi:hypothetical protein